MMTITRMTVKMVPGVVAARKCVELWHAFAETSPGVVVHWAQRTKGPRVA